MEHSRFRASAIAAFLLLGALVAVPGCASDSPKTSPVTGVVTLAGQPVEGAAVQFFPVATEGGGTGAQALSKADGTFEVETTFDAGKTMEKGMRPGEYRVTVAKLETPAAGPLSRSRPKNLLPPAYGMVESTKLQVTVKPGEPNHFELKL